MVRRLNDYHDLQEIDGLHVRSKPLTWSEAEERAVVQQLDRRLVLFVAFLYMLSFLDRSNIGNARLAGMDIDLRLNSSRFEWLLQSFYVTYIAFQWMTLLWKVFRPSRYRQCSLIEGSVHRTKAEIELVAICVASWGLIASLQCLTTSYEEILILRACLGIGEAAFVGIPFYLSFFFTNHELAFRVGLFISAAPLATAFAGTVAWLITKFADKLPIASWRLLFLFEGFPSLVVAIFVWIYVPDEPRTARFLTTRQRKIAEKRISNLERGQGLNWQDILSTLMDPKAILTALMFFCCNVAFSSLPVFLPTIIEEMGYSTLASQGLTAPPFLTACAVVIVTAWLSDRYRARSAFIIFHALLATFGYALMSVTGFLQSGPLTRYIGVYPAASGFFSAVALLITWILNLERSDTGKGTGISVLNYVGQLGPLVGIRLFNDNQKPFYVRGLAICAIAMLIVAFLAFWLRIILKRHRDMEESTEAPESNLLVVGVRQNAQRWII